MATLFTKIINREIPAKIVYETDKVCAFQDIHPQAPHHIVIVPKAEIPTINDLTPETAHYVGDLFLAAKEIATQLGVTEKGYRVVMNCNGDGGQTVFHIHLHLLAGRPMTWPPG
ncbi:MAG: histidine triad nucleotide-binding protein [Bdellovibrionales bacterium]|nr:histidine triad nucleotide-binding protein [Bdellovibrionales bacterium]